MADVTCENSTEIQLEVFESEGGLFQANDNSSAESQVLLDFDKEIFIEAVRKFRCLWDINDHSYKDRNMKVNAWKQLAVLFQKDGECLATF